MLPTPTALSCQALCTEDLFAAYLLRQCLRPIRHGKAVFAQGELSIASSVWMETWVGGGS